MAVTIDSRSVAVRRYVRAVLARDHAKDDRDAATLAHDLAEVRVKVALGKLTGGQLGEAQRLLKALAGNGAA